MSSQHFSGFACLECGCVPLCSWLVRVCLRIAQRGHISNRIDIRDAGTKEIIDHDPMVQFEWERARGGKLRICAGPSTCQDQLARDELTVAGQDTSHRAQAV